MKQPWEVAQTLVGTPFLHMGRTTQGVDCVGLIVLTCQLLGQTPIDKKVYGREPYNDGLQEYLRLNCGDPLPREDGYAINDIVLIQFPKHLAPSHIGVVAPHPQGLGLIHCYATVGKVVYHRINDHWDRRIVEIYRWPAKY